MASPTPSTKHGQCALRTLKSRTKAGMHIKWIQRFVIIIGNISGTCAKSTRIRWKAKWATSMLWVSGLWAVYFLLITFRLSNNHTPRCQNWNSHCSNRIPWNKNIKKLNVENGKRNALNKTFLTKSPPPHQCAVPWLIKFHRLIRRPKRTPPTERVLKHV